MSSVNQEYLGKTVRFPLSIINGSPQLATDTELIKGSLIMLLTTPLGTRELLPDYGCRIDELLWEPNDKILQTLLRTSIVEAVNKWERRIKLLGVSIITKDDLTLCALFYRILKSNETDTFIYPFNKKQLPY